MNSLMRTLFRIVFKIDARELRKLPSEGPAVIMSNHTSNLEGPAYYVFIQPARATALGKIELWKNPFTRFFMQVWNIIPLRRGQVDRKAIRKTMQALDDRYIIGIAPEGKRSRDGSMRQAHPGVALLASRKRVPIYPVAHWGFVDFLPCLKRLRRARVSFRVGEPFCVKQSDSGRPSSNELREITDEMMYRLAALLPEHLRGYYADLSKMQSKHLETVCK